MRCAAALQQLNVPLRFTSITASKSSSFMRASSPSRVMPALFTSTSTRPNASWAASMSAAASAASATLAATAMARTPQSASRAAANARASSSPRSL